jgi:hypothetical protein
MKYMLIKRALKKKRGLVLGGAGGGCKRIQSSVDQLNRHDYGEMHGGQCMPQWRQIGNNRSISVQLE